MSQMIMQMGPERRRRWSTEDQRRILATAFAPGAVVADVARRNEIATSLIYKWRREASAEDAAFAPAVLIEEPADVSPLRDIPVINVELANGARISFSATAPAPRVSAISRALR
jgi:transposase